MGRLPSETPRILPKSLAVVLLTLSPLAVLAGGCSQAEVSHVMAYGEEKSKLLNESLEKFTKALYWGSVDEAALFVKPKIRRQFVVKERKRKKKERTVDIEPEDVLYDIGTDEAIVTIAVKYYKVPFYIVKDRQEKQTWRYFRFKGGWKLVSREFIEKNEAQPGK